MLSDRLMAPAEAKLRTTTVKTHIAALWLCIEHNDISEYHCSQYPHEDMYQALHVYVSADQDRSMLSSAIKLE